MHPGPASGAVLKYPSCSASTSLAASREEEKILLEARTDSSSTFTFISNVVEPSAHSALAREPELLIIGNGSVKVKSINTLAGLNMVIASQICHWLIARSEDAYWTIK